MRMHKLLAAAALGACLLSGSAWAQTATETRLEALEKRIQQLEERLAERDAAMMEKEQALAKLQAKVAVQEQTAADIRAKAEESGGGWTDGLEIGGAIEVVLVHDSPFDGKSTSSNDLDNAEVALAAQINEQVSAELVLVHDGDDGDDIFVDTATFTYDIGGGLSLTAGKAYPPFAVFDTAFWTGTLGEDMGGIDDTIVQVDFESEAGFSGSMFAFNGDADYKNDRIDKFGVQLGFGTELGGLGFNAGVGWVNDIREGDGFVSDEEDWPPMGSDRTAGVAVHAGLTSGPLTFNAHYLTVRDKLEEVPWSVMTPDSLSVNYDTTDTENPVPDNEPGVGAAQPSTYGVEVGYTFDTGEREFTLSAGWQRSREALAIEMPENRFLIGVATELGGGIGVGLEYVRSNDYGTGDCLGWEVDDGGTDYTTDSTDDTWAATSCGSGKSGGTFSLLLSAEF